ncbi:MAG TPA: prolipoprotein diacylglyceryl transferase [Acidobacteriota bacterium]|nr:prolipoprotein diacylglyceryl transferase [Acidobacteriota bacterium]
MFPILFRLPIPGIGPITIHTYGVLLVVAFLVAVIVARRLARREGIDADQMVDLGVYVILGGLVGAKLLLLIVDHDFYGRQFHSILEDGGGSVGQVLSPYLGSFGAFLGTVSRMGLSLLQAGGVFYGGMIAGLVVGAWYLRRYAMPMWKATDVAAPAIAIAHAFGRVGCFAAGCCYGIPTDAPWGVTFDNSYSGTLVGVPLNIPLHPTQLYSALGNLAIFGLLLWFYKRKKFDGQVFWVYVLGYGVFRFVLEFWRGDPRGSIFGGMLSTSQFVSIVMVTLALGMLARLRAGVQKTAESTT